MFFLLSANTKKYDNKCILQTSIFNLMSTCITEETGWERPPTGVGGLVRPARPATAAPVGGTSAPQNDRPK